MTKQATLELTSWNTFCTDNLVVVPELLGKSHMFAFEQREVEISLPGIEYLTDDHTRDARLQIGSRRAQDEHIFDVYVLTADADPRLI